jgi:hypothetical protein
MEAASDYVDGAARGSSESSGAMAEDILIDIGAEASESEKPATPLGARGLLPAALGAKAGMVLATGAFQLERSMENPAKHPAVPGAVAFAAGWGGVAAAHMLKRPVPTETADAVAYWSTPAGAGAAVVGASAMWVGARHNMYAATVAGALLLVVGWVLFAYGTTWHEANPVRRHLLWTGIVLVMAGTISEKWAQRDDVSPWPGAGSWRMSRAMFAAGWGIFGTALGL